MTLDDINDKHQMKLQTSINSVTKICYVGNDLIRATDHAKTMNIMHLNSIQVLGPSGFYHVKFADPAYNNTQWEILLFADIHHQLTESRFDLTTEPTVERMMNDMITRGTCIDFFLEQRLNTIQSAESCQNNVSVSTGYLHQTKCVMKDVCMELYGHGSEQKTELMTCIPIYVKARLHALDFRTVNGIKDYQALIHSNIYVPTDISVMWDTVIQAVTTGQITIRWYSDTVHAYYTKVIDLIFSALQQSVFSTNDVSKIQENVGQCITTFYSLPRTLKRFTREVSSIMLAVDARLFDLLYIFAMFRRDPYCTASHEADRNVLGFFGYQHVQFMTLLIESLVPSVGYEFSMKNRYLRSKASIKLTPREIKTGYDTNHTVHLLNTPFY